MNKLSRRDLNKALLLAPFVPSILKAAEPEIIPCETIRIAKDCGLIFEHCGVNFHIANNDEELVIRLWNNGRISCETWVSFYDFQIRNLQLTICNDKVAKPFWTFHVFFCEEFQFGVFPNGSKNDNDNYVNVLLSNFISRDTARYNRVSYKKSMSPWLTITDLKFV